MLKYFFTPFIWHFRKNSHEIDEMMVRVWSFCLCQLCWVLYFFFSLWWKHIQTYDEKCCQLRHEVHSTNSVDFYLHSKLFRSFFHPFLLIQLLPHVLKITHECNEHRKKFLHNSLSTLLLQHIVEAFIILMFN